MSDRAGSISGGCLCGQLRYTATAAPIYTGYCCCADCRRASGSGYSPFLGFAAADVSFTGDTQAFRSASFRGGEAVRNRCPHCGSLVFGGAVGQDDTHTIYAGSLDDPALFEPKVAIFNRDRPAWVALPEGLQVFETMPG